MNSLSNTEIAEKYKVSKPTVARWIELAILKKNNLELIEFNKKVRVLDSLHNLAELERLAQEGRKFRSNIEKKDCYPSKKFYEDFDTEQIAEIIRDLELKRQLNLKYTYFDGGAKLWDETYRGGVSPVKTAVSGLVDNLIYDLIFLLKSEDLKVNIIDIGPGNGLPVIPLLKEFETRDRLNKYISIDISSQMNTIAKQNISREFPNLQVNQVISDIEKANFTKIFMEYKENNKNIVNIILLVDDICNQDDKSRVLKNLQNSMDKNDILIFSYTIDNVNSRSVLNYNKNSGIHKRQIWPLLEMGIDAEKCEYSLSFDEKLMAKTKSLKLDKDYTLHFNIFNTEKIVELNAGEEINIWKHYMYETKMFLNDIEEAGLNLEILKLDKKLDTGLVVCRVDV